MIREDDVVALLRAAADDIDVPTAPAERLADAGRARRRRRRLAAGAAAATVLAVAVAIPVALMSRGSQPTGATSGPTTGLVQAPCVDPVPAAVLPTWARAGFSDPKPRIPYVLGDDGDIVAILFGQPLTSPPSPDHGNKVLWIAREAAFGQTLHITATRAGTSTSVSREVVGGPGPSYLDLPEPGCWHLALRWGDRTDSLDLAIRAP